MNIYLKNLKFVFCRMVSNKKALSLNSSYMLFRGNAFSCSAWKKKLAMSIALWVKNRMLPIDNNPHSSVQKIVNRTSYRLRGRLWYQADFWTSVSRQEKRWTIISMLKTWQNRNTFSIYLLIEYHTIIIFATIKSGEKSSPFSPSCFICGFFLPEKRIHFRRETA